MDLIDIAPEAEERAVPDLSSRAASLLPAARKIVWDMKAIPSARHLQRTLRVRFPTAAEVRAAMVEEYPGLPEAPVSPAASGAGALGETTAAYPVLPAPLPQLYTAAPVPPVMPAAGEHTPGHAGGPRPATYTQHPATAADAPRRRGLVVLLLPLLLVNSAALYGQAGWAYDHLARVWILAGLFAAAVESIGVYLAAEAHAALMAGDASARLRIASYAVGALVGALNYAHFAGPGYGPTPLALTFGLLSSISPWLWAIRSRSLNRDRLRELGQIDPRAVRFAVLRWVLFPVRTASAFRGAVWAGIVQPGEAVAAADARRAAKHRGASA